MKQTQHLVTVTWGEDLPDKQIDMIVRNSIDFSLMPGWVRPDRTNPMVVSATTERA